MIEKMTLIHELHTQALETAKRFKRAEADLVEIFQRIEETRTFAKLGYASLFEYGVKALELSESNVYAFIQVARKSREIPALKEAIREGTLTVSKAKKIVSVITPENQSDWLMKAQMLSKDKIEKEVAKVNPKLAVVESSKYVSETRLELKLGVSEELMEKLKRIQDLESQRTQKAVSLEDAFEVLTELYLHKNDPVRKAERFKSQQAKPQLVPGLVPNQGRVKIPSFTRHALNQRDQGQCTHMNPDGTRCGQRRWVEIHHIKPISKGGQNSISNLTTPCFQHHRFVHRNG